MFHLRKSQFQVHTYLKSNNQTLTKNNHFSKELNAYLTIRFLKLD
jgi:hypothetical protein